MIHPKFPRRTLALILLCLVLTLGVVGIIFLVYFFNEKSALLMENPLKTIYGTQNQNQHYRQNIIGDGGFEYEPKPTYRYSKDLEGNNINQVKVYYNRTTLLENSKENLPSLSSASVSQEFESSQGKQALLVKKTITAKDSNLDTIYIDDVERPSYSSKTKSESSNIDYFDMIIVDHKNEDALKYKVMSMQQPKADSQPLPDPVASGPLSKEYQHDRDQRKSTINRKRQNNISNLWNKTKLLRHPKKDHNTHEDDYVYDLEIETAGSGSGDFFDDTEINELFNKQVNSKLKLIKKENIIRKNNHTRKKYRNLFTQDTNFFPPPTVSSSEEPDNWVNRKSRIKLDFYSTISPEGPKQKQMSSSKPWQSQHNSGIWPDLTNHKLLVNGSSISSTNIPSPRYKSVVQTQLELREVESTATEKVLNYLVANLRETGASENNEAWIETRTRRIMGNVKKSEERSRQLLLCEEAGGGELCRMLFKGHIND